MQVIISVISRSADSFVYIALLLMVCCFIFTLLGKTIFGNKFNYEEKPRGNFDTFPIALITVFQVLTMENWQFVAFDAMSSEVGKWIPAIYMITWIFAGNFILLNLFLAILLDSFLEEDESGELTDEQEEEKRAKKQRKKEKKKTEQARKLKRLGMSLM
jgi:voltage-dependent calcium channel L type alpha-1S